MAVGQKPVVIFGTSEIAQLAAYYFAYDGERSIAAFTVDAAFRKADMFEGKPLIDFEILAEKYPPAHYDLFVATSYARMNSLRRDKCRQAKALGYMLPSYISPRAMVFSDLVHGDNCFILEGNIIQPFVRIGNHVTLWGGSHIGHASVIEDDVFIASHVVVSGGVTIGRGSFLGVNASLRDHIRIGIENIIGAGVNIMADTPDYAVYRAEPQKPLPLNSQRIRWD